MMICETCEKPQISIPPEDLLSQRGYLWHRPCARIIKFSDGKEFIDFPSDGKLTPTTIMH